MSLLLHPISHQLNAKLAGITLFLVLPPGVHNSGNGLYYPYRMFWTFLTE